MDCGDIASRWPRRFGAVVQNILTFLAAGFLILYTAAQFDSDVPMRILHSDLNVTTAEDGKSFFVSRETCLDRAVPAIGLPRLVGVGSPYLIPLPPKALSAIVGCGNYEVLVLIPEEVPAGEYDYKITYRFTMNPFKTVEFEAPPVRVKVLR
jgi:hypothetical protein